MLSSLANLCIELWVILIPVKMLWFTKFSKRILRSLWESMRNSSPVMVWMSHQHHSVRGLTLGAQYASESQSTLLCTSKPFVVRLFFIQDHLYLGVYLFDCFPVGCISWTLPCPPCLEAHANRCLCWIKERLICEVYWRRLCIDHLSTLCRWHQYSWVLD